MKVSTIFAGAALSLLCFGSAARAAAPPTLLPPSFGSFAQNGSEIRTGASDLARIAGPEASIVREYGVTSAEQAGYSQNGQKAGVTLYQMTDPTAAYGLFTYLRTPDVVPLSAAPPVAYAARGKDHSLLVIGNFLLDITSARLGSGDVKAIAAALRPYADRAPYPIIAQYLPDDGIEANSERYALGPQVLAQVFPVVPASAGNWIGFDKNAEAMVAHYHLKGQPQGSDVLLLVALYPTQQIAAEKYGQFSQWIKLNNRGDADSSLPVVFGKQSGSLVALVANVGSEDIANILLNQIQYIPQVTWNAPTHELTDPGIGAIIVGTFMGTGAIMLLAVAAGIGFGGVRLIVKLLFPGKVFDRDGEVEILQLGLSGKRIESKDFYLIDSSKGT